LKIGVPSSKSIKDAKLPIVKSTVRE